MPGHARMPSPDASDRELIDSARGGDESVSIGRGLAGRSSILLVLLAVGLGPGPAAVADPPARPASSRVGRAADAVLAALSDEDDAALLRLAGRDVPDPWTVADELLGRGRRDAARRLAAAAPRRLTQGLAAWGDAFPAEDPHAS
jgi:hypothetical protein